MNDELEVSIYAHFLNKLHRLDCEWMKLEPAGSSAAVFDRQQESNFGVWDWRFEADKRPLRDIELKKNNKLFEDFTQPEF